MLNFFMTMGSGSSPDPNIYYRTKKLPCCCIFCSGTAFLWAQTKNDRRGIPLRRVTPNCTNPPLNKSGGFLLLAAAALASPRRRARWGAFWVGAYGSLGFAVPHPSRLRRATFPPGEGFGGISCRMGVHPCPLLAVTFTLHPSSVTAIAVPPSPEGEGFGAVELGGCRGKPTWSAGAASALRKVRSF